MKHVLTLREFSGEALAELVESAATLKREREAHQHTLDGLGQLILMAKTSTRTTLSFSAAMGQMGGFTTKLDFRESNFGISRFAYEAQYVSSNSDVIMARLLTFDDVQELARVSRVPVINGCCNSHHPSQAIADMLTLSEVAGGLDGVSLAYVGVHNNVTNSLVVACSKLGVELRLVTPQRNKAAWTPDLMQEAEATGLITYVETVAEAAATSDFIYTDTWLDMEFFNDAELLAKRTAEMAPFQLSRAAFAGADPYVMHDMPIHPGYEIDEELVDVPKAVIFQQAENRLYAAKALLKYCLEG